MSNRSRGLAVSCMIVQLAMCDKVLAEEPAKGGYRELRGGIPAEAQIELAKVGTSIWYTVNTKEGSTLRQVVAEVCGQQPAEVLDALLTEGVRLNLLKGPDDVIEKDVAVAVPFCLKVEQNVSVEIKSGDTLEKILNENYGVSGPKTLNKVYKANKAEFDAKNFTEFASKLPVGRQILVPMAEPRVFSARPDLGVSFESVLAGGEISASVRSQVESASVPVDQPPDPGAPKFDTIESVEFESTGASCAPPGQVASVVDLDLLRERFAVEEQAKKDFDGQDAQSVIVGIIDSGLSEPGDSFFKPKYLSPNPGEFQKDLGEDDDGNGYWDDVYGINFNSSSRGSGEIRPYPTSGAIPISRNEDGRSHSWRSCGRVGMEQRSPQLRNSTEGR